METLWNILSTAAFGLLVVSLGYVAWYRWITRNRRKAEPGYDYVMVIDEGSARELTRNEREYIETPFHPADGARPYIKSRYEAVDGWGSMAGFIRRRQLPSRVPIRNTTEEEERLLGG